jgi:pilus assembly protein CpaB
MRVITIVSLGASAVLGLGALVVAKTVLPNQAAAKVAGLTAQQSVGVPVVVAARDLKFGDKVDADHLRLTRLPQEAVPQGAFTSVQAVLSADHGGAPVVLTPIAAREPMLPAKLSGPGARASVAAEITDGMRAYTIKVTDVSGVGGHALPGDRVDVVLQRDLNPNGPIHNYISQIVIQDVRVLAVDLNLDQASNKPATPSTATLEVSVEDSQKLSIASDLGKLSLALRRTGSAETAAADVVRTSVFAGGSGGGSAAPVRRSSASVVHAHGEPILVVYGDRRGNGGAHHLAAPAAPAPAAPAPASAAPAANTASVG